jgi:inorganic pyrophosphatase
VPGSIISCRIIGALLMEDEAGADEKLLAVPSAWLTARYDAVQQYSDIPDITLKQIEHFFRSYKDLEPGKWVKVLGWVDASRARQIVSEGIARQAALPK